MAERAIQRQVLFNESAPGANTAVFTAITPSDGATTMRLTIAVTTSTVVNVVAAQSGTTHKWGLNESAALNAADLYVFEWDIDPSSTYTIEYETDSITETLILTELVSE